ncbi:MAG: NADPH:quinone oxidoreductase family protein, partial [Alphaproteobacteria bacterium]|nr:NADPH:quinone oxidoreductase family protein [Alphaproteobacteria bacterium]
MRAIQVIEFGSVDGARVAEIAEPTLRPGEVLVAVHAAPVNYVDLLVIGGTYQFRPPLPFTPGKGPAGVVAALGSGVDRLAVGDRVLAMAEIGGYAERVAVGQSQCYRLPRAMSFVEAASLSLAYDTAWFALRERGRLQPGETALVLGASGAVGLAAVQLAKAMGASVLAGIGRMEKAQDVRRAGADAVIDLSRGDLRDSLRVEVHAATQGRGADVVVDPLGGDAFDAALRAMAWRGRCVVVGFAAGRIPVIKANYLLVKNIEVSGLQISDYRKRQPELLATCYAELFAWYEAGKLAPAQAELYPLDRAAAALTAVR